MNNKIRPRKCLWPTSSVIAIAFLALPALCHAEGVLDQQLDTKPATPPVKPDEKKPAPEAVPRPAPNMISPSAEKAVDDSDLIHKLTGAKDDQDANDKMKEMVDRMAQSQSRLRAKDAGPITQETQRRIVTDLDVMIEYARKQQQQSSKSQSQSQDQKPEQRQVSKGQQQGPSQEGGNQAAQNSSLRQGSISAAQSNGEDMRQKGPQEWGGLPAKDRDLVSNGANEQYLPAYKEMIDRYYQALAEIGKSKQR